MINWNNLDTLVSFTQLKKTKEVNLSDVMSGEAGAERVKNYNVPMACGLNYNYAAKKVDSEVLNALVKLADEAQLADKFKALYNGEVINTGEKRLVLHHMTRGQLGDAVNADGVDKRSFYKTQQERIAEFANKVHNGEITNAAGEKFTTVVQIGIGQVLEEFVILGPFVQRYECLGRQARYGGHVVLERARGANRLRVRVARAAQITVARDVRAAGAVRAGVRNLRRVRKRARIDRLGVPDIVPDRVLALVVAPREAAVLDDRREVDRHAQVLEYFRVDVRTDIVALVVAASAPDHRFLIQIAEESVVLDLLGSALQRQVVLVLGRHFAHQVVYPVRARVVGIGAGVVLLYLLFGEPGRFGRLTRLDMRFAHEFGILSGRGHSHQVRRVLERDRAVQRDRRLAFLASLGRDQNHAVAGPGSVYRCRGVLKHRDRLDFVRVDVVEVAFHAVDDHQWRIEAPDAERRGVRSGQAALLFGNQARQPSGQRVGRTGDRCDGQILRADRRDGSRQAFPLGRAVADDDHFLQFGGFLFQRDVDPGPAADFHLLRNIAQIGDLQHVLRRCRDPEAAVRSRGGAVGRPLHEYVGADNRVAQRVGDLSCYGDRFGRPRGDMADRDVPVGDLVSQTGSPEQ